MLPNLEKNSIRKALLAQRRALPIDDINTCSEIIIQHIKKLSCYEKARNIGFYSPINGEVNLSALWADALSQKKSCYFPVIDQEHQMLFLPHTTEGAWCHNHYGIAEPDQPKSKAKNANQLDLILVPLLAFDLSLNRLGMGKGYYDKTLIDTQATLVGVGYEFQKQDLIPVDPWDIPLDMVITELKTYQHPAR